MWLRIFEHLLPDARAWRLRVGKKLRALFEGLVEAPESARAFVDAVYLDLFPEITRDLPGWEAQFALPGTGTEPDRRSLLAAAWAATGGQSPRYLQEVVQAAGFDLYIHEWWSTGPGPYVARDPRDHTNQPLIGTVRCKPAGPTQILCRELAMDEHRCNAFLANDTHYLVNKDLTRSAPPAVPSDPNSWPYFLYFGGQAFPALADVPTTRREELEELLLKICPAHLWIVLLVNWT